MERRRKGGAMANLEGLILRFTETMSGFLGVGDTDPRKGAEAGRRAGTPLAFGVTIRITDLGRFLRDPNHPAELTGTVTFPPLGGSFPIRDGRFNLFAIDPQTGIREMTYTFRFTAGDGAEYLLTGHKEIYDDPGKVDVVGDMTRLFTVLHRGIDENAPIYGAGELYFRLLDTPKLMASMEVENATSWRQKPAALLAFASFAYGALRDEYLKDIRPVYDTDYDNLVLAGELESADGRRAPFFFVSGTHGRGFPWGDNEIFWDVILAVGDGAGGYQRYAITDRVLEGLGLDLPAGRYRYDGPLFEITEGYAASFKQMRSGARHLSRREASLEAEFETMPKEAVTFPFPVMSELLRKMSSEIGRKLREVLPGTHPLGIQITPHAVTPRAGKFRIGAAEWNIVSGRTFGEAEHGTFCNLKEPTLLYNYLCAIEPERKAARVQIRSDTLRDERHHWTKDRIDALIGRLVRRKSSAEFLVGEGPTRVRSLAPEGKPEERAEPFRKVGEPLVEVNNDHFPTAVFQRRIVEVDHPAAGRRLALEEDMLTLRLEAVNSDRTVTVASIRDDDKLRALDRVLEETGFDALVDAKLAGAGKDRNAFHIVIKPNFMFAYDKADRSTYTDPELVGHLVKRLRERGYQAIHVVEAQSTYGEYFDKRSVREMAEYLGYDGSAGCDVIDMTLDAVEKRDFGPHLGRHPVSRVWRDADFRISFAKNKTHAYSYYTLTLKNIYGALPLGNKFKEYHCDRDIYHTTIEYLKAFPVDYGLIDGHLSADGPFGIFADPAPNETHTIIGGADLVAVDWVGASKMGTDPMISKYMQLAVEEFGKPEIRLAGDGSLYRPWLNVPEALTLLTHKGMDANYQFGNLLYMVSSQMDESRFRHKSKALPVRLLRQLTVPLRRTFFVRTGEDPSLGNRLASWLLYRMGY